MPQTRYINVILPLKLEWEPFYALPSEVDSLTVGDRVLAPFAGHSYLGVVSAVNVTPPANVASRVRPIYGPDTRKAHISQTEIAFWRTLADYYMCTVGEVYKAAYPSVKDELVSPRKKPAPEIVQTRVTRERTNEQKARLAALWSGFGEIVQTRVTRVCANELEEVAYEVAEQGGNVLWLVPQILLGKQQEAQLKEVFGSRLMLWGTDITPARKREVARRMRSGEPYVVIGTRSALFLPHNNLKLVIVQDEHDPSYKQSSPSPRYNARDAAVLLAGVMKSAVLLQSATPSFETLMNVHSGKFEFISDDSAVGYSTDIIDVRAELRKRGMVGDIPRKIIAMPSEGLVVMKPRRAAFPTMEEMASQVEANLSGVTLVDDAPNAQIPEDTKVLAVFGLDAMLGKQDFRADERAVQIVLNAAARCPQLQKLILVSHQASHPVFNAIASGNTDALVAERRSFMLPPFSRIIDVQIHDTIPSRQFSMTGSLASHLAAAFGVSLLPSEDAQGVRIMQMEGCIRIILPRDRNLAARKQQLRLVVSDFEKLNKYPSHITFDVDPL